MTIGMLSSVFWWARWTELNSFSYLCPGGAYRAGYLTLYFFLSKKFCVELQNSGETNEKFQLQWAHERWLAVHFIPLGPLICGHHHCKTLTSGCALVFPSLLFTFRCITKRIQANNYYDCDWCGIELTVHSQHSQLGTRSLKKMRQASQTRSHSWEEAKKTF